MGYTHYWIRSGSFPRQRFRQFITDVKELIQIMEKEYNIGLTDLILNDNLVQFNGNEGHELFRMPRIVKNGRVFSFCKTARKPYDLLVKAVLILAKYYFKIKIHSDGDFSEWAKAIVLVADHVGEQKAVFPF